MYDSNSSRAIILLHKDGSVHLCCDNYTTYHLSAEMLISFLSAPTAFLDSPINKVYESTDQINPTAAGLDKLPGVTLATFTYARKLTIIFPELLKHAFAVSTSPEKANKLNMSNFINQLDQSDAKAFLLRYFLEFSREAAKGKIVQNIFNIDEESFYSIMREIFNASSSFVPPKPPSKTVEQRLNEALQKSAIEKKEDDFLIPISQYGQQNGIPYNIIINSAKSGKLKTVVMKGRNYFVDYREPVPKAIRQGAKNKSNGVKASVQQTPEASDRINMSREEVQQHISDNKLFSNLVGRYIYTWTECAFYVDNNYREVQWDGLRYLICNIDMSLKDENGRTNEERIEAKESPVTYNPETNQYAPVPLHHLGQRDSVLVPIEQYFHSKFYSVFHAAEPIPNIHGTAFESAKKTFWKKYLEMYKKYEGFDNIPYIYPVNRNNK